MMGADSCAYAPCAVNKAPMVLATVCDALPVSRHLSTTARNTLVESERAVSGASLAVQKNRDVLSFSSMD